MSDNITLFLVFIGGTLMLFLGFAPIVSRKYFDRMYERIWKDDSKIMTERSSYVYNRYYRQVNYILLGAGLVGYVLMKLFKE